MHKLSIKQYARGHFANNVLILMTGTIISQGINLAISPILTRIYAPGDFGIFALYMSVVSLFSIISTGRYEMAIMLPADDEDAVNIMALSVLITFTISLLALVIVALFNERLALALGDIKIASWLYLIPISIFLTGTYQTLNYWSNRNKKYKRLSISRIIQYATASLSNVGMGLAGFGTGGLIGGSLLGQSVATGVLGMQVKKEIIPLKNKISVELIKKNARKYKNFPFINSLHAFVDVLQYSGTNFIISSFFSNYILGLYSLTVRILRAPLTILGSALAQVFLQKASETYNQGGDLQKLVKKTILGLSLIALPIFCLIYIFSPFLFSFVFGPPWRVAGEYARILSPWLCMNFIVSPVSQIPVIVNKQREVFYISLLGNSLILLSILYGGIIAHNIKVGFYVLSFSQLIYLSGALLWILKISGGKNKKYA